MGPLGLLTDDVSNSVLRQLEAIEAIDFVPMKARMNVDFPTSPQQLDRMEREVKRFLALVALEGSNGHVVSEKIDSLWHYFVLHTREYEKFCHDVFGRFLHHVPILPHEKARLATAYLRTRDAYTRFFGPPPADMWGDHEQICWGGCDEYAPEKIEDSIVTH